MIKSILVPLFGSERDKASLGTALALARPFDAHLDCLHVRTDPRLIIANVTTSMGTGAGDFSEELFTALVEADKRRAAAARKFFDAFCDANKIAVGDAEPGLSAAFREIEADPSREIAANARFSDVVVFAPTTVSGEAYFDPAGDVLVRSGRPVILSPAKPAATFGARIALAWKETAEAARAVTAAMPLLAKAKEVVVISACEGSAQEEEVVHSAERLAGLLRRHGCHARAETLAPEPDDIAAAVIACAREEDCDLLVMGGYGHSRVREFILGGFTRHVLGDAKLPVFMLH